MPAKYQCFHKKRQHKTTSQAMNGCKKWHYLNLKGHLEEKWVCSILYTTYRSASLLTVLLWVVPTWDRPERCIQIQMGPCAPDLKALLEHVHWLRYHYWQEFGNLEATGGFAAHCVILAQFRAADEHSTRDKARLFLLTHLYSVKCHSVRSDAGKECLLSKSREVPIWMQDKYRFKVPINSFSLVSVSIAFLHPCAACL